MRIVRNFFTTLFLVSFVVSMVGGLLWANLNFVRQVPGGSDFVVAWKSMRNFMMSSDAPYGENTVVQIQTQIYGRAARSAQYPYNVNIPLFLLILYLPLAWLKDFVLARAFWMIVLELSLFGVVLLSLRLARWKVHWSIGIFLLIFGVSWQPSVSMLMTGTSVMVQAFLFLLAFRNLELGADELAGALIALTFINLEITGFVLVTLLVWIISNQRWRVLGGMLMMLILLMILSFILLPGWVLPFMTATIANLRSGVVPSTYGIVESWLPGIGLRLAQILSVVALAILFLEWWAVRGQDVRWLFWTACLSAAVAPLLGIPFFPQWLAFTLPGVLLVVAVMVKRWRLLGFISAFVMLIGLFSGLWLAQRYGFTSVFLLFYPLLLTVLLYWVRWGAIHHTRLWVDEIMLKG